MAKIDRNNPASLRAEAARLNAYADRLNNESRRASDNAPSSYVTGASGRSRAMNKRTERALEKTITNAVKSNAARRNAALLERRAAWLESGGPERDHQRKIASRKADVIERRDRKQALKAGTLEDRLFVGHFPVGLVFCDRSVEQNGDYKRLAILYERTLVLVFERDCPADWKAFVAGYAATYQTDIGRQTANGCGQVTTWGHAHGNDFTFRFYERDGELWEVIGESWFPGAFAVQRSAGGGPSTMHPDTIRPLILAWESAQEPTDHPIITGPDGRTYPRLEEHP